jgi:hypothetical protein
VPRECLPARARESSRTPAGRRSAPIGRERRSASGRRSRTRAPNPSVRLADAHPGQRRPPLEAPWSRPGYYRVHLTTIKTPRARHSVRASSCRRGLDRDVASRRLGARPRPTGRWGVSPRSAMRRRLRGAGILRRGAGILRCSRRWRPSGLPSCPGDLSSAGSADLALEQRRGEGGRCDCDPETPDHRDPGVVADGLVEQ